ncbi:MAG: methanogenesis marker 2 protein [Candidatus Methanoplasma sp.]|jgi:putative methanogenesis marker protein 2|nr:methanogenesis marker 2 protein [Candidatus Methanoplasma sp.]
MSLDSVMDAIRSFPGVTRKRPIREVVGFFPTSSFPRVAAAEGEDAAAISYGDDYILFATDGIMESLVSADPFYAGYFAVLVNVNDIAAMGGRPLAMVDVVSMSKSKVCNQILRGIGAGVEKFNVPIVGGHTHPDCKYNAIDISIIGTVPKDDIILSSTVEDGDDIVFVMDLDGFYPEGLMYAWDTTSRKDACTVQNQMEAVAVLASRRLVHAGKDMSNPGSVGTLGMMLETSRKGASIDVGKIPVPEGADLTRWLLAYQGCGFVFACPPENSAEVIEHFRKAGCDGAVVGKADGGSELKITVDGETGVLFDFKKDMITGCSPKK